jgi:hypothetical protein
MRGGWNEEEGTRGRAEEAIRGGSEEGRKG